MVNRVRNGKVKETEAGRGKAGLISYLAKLGLGDSDLAEVMSLLHPREAEQPTDVASHAVEVIQPERAADVASQVAEVMRHQRPAVVSDVQTIRLYLAEEQQILRDAYRSFFSAHATIDLLGTTGDTSGESLVQTVAELEPNVMLLGVKTVKPATVEKLRMLREARGELGIVLLFAMYDIEGIKALREFFGESSGGCAYLLKHTVDTAEQLTQVIHSVAEGRITIDPMVMEELIGNGDAKSGFMSELSPKELEVLSWMAKGYRNDTIADVLGRDVKTVERHINNIYGKLHSSEGSESMDRRVGASLTYLAATGLLQRDHFNEE